MIRVRHFSSEKITLWMVNYSAIIVNILLAVQGESGMSGWFIDSPETSAITETFERDIAFYFFDIVHRGKLN